MSKKRRKQRKKSRPTPTGIQRPGRYAGHEWNLPLPTTDPVVRVVLCYPDVYEIGMSHLGLQVLYQILREMDDVSVERVFAPWPDKEKKLRETGKSLTSLESNEKLSKADVICITLPHELSFTNVINILDLATIPIDRENRNHTMPLIIGGGISALNPTPMEAYFDAFLIGEAEDQFQSIINLLKNGQSKNTLQTLSEIPGMYVPGIHGDCITRENSVVITKQIVKDLNQAPHPNPQLVPYCRPVHERVVVEAARGCPRKCRFCQASVYYSPARFRKADLIQNLVLKNLEQTGYDEVSILSLNIADYPGIENLIMDLMQKLHHRQISVSLPSLRPEKLTEKMINQIRQVRKTGFTLAPEAGTDRLRAIIGKPYSKTKLLESVAAIFKAGWNKLKLYFMIGQPFETDDDVIGIVHLVNDILKIGRKFSGGRVSLTVSVSTFIPKPHTPFQWTGQASTEDLYRRQKILHQGCNAREIKLSLGDIFISRLEAYLSRGNQDAGRVIRRAHHYGCRMDAWNELFNREGWKKAFADCNVDMEAEATRNYPVKPGSMVWSFINTLVPEEKLMSEFERANAAAAFEYPEEPASNFTG
ncbi:TIGR03960 family B12-binding radical SAM protein, partial [bacterium]|nr:TIGR03960 family B12-binding radical SAM protein [bacterium]